MPARPPPAPPPPPPPPTPPPPPPPPPPPAPPTTPSSTTPQPPPTPTTTPPPPPSPSVVETYIVTPSGTVASGMFITLCSAAMELVSGAKKWSIVGTVVGTVRSSKCSTFSCAHFDRLRSLTDGSKRQRFRN